VGVLLFENAGVNFTLMGIDEYEEQYKKSFVAAVSKLDFTKPSMLVGEGVKRVMDANYYKEYFNFIKPDGRFKRVDIGAVFKAETELESNDVILMSKESVREIFEMKENKATDIVVRVANFNEVATIDFKNQTSLSRHKSYHKR